MKFQRHQRHDQRRLSHPSRGAWIEISHSTVTVLKTLSHPSRGAWIEITTLHMSLLTHHRVAPLTGCVD